MNFSISLVNSLSRLLLNGRRENLLAKLFFFPSIYLILKSHSRIYASHFVIKALGKLIAAQFSYITKVFIFILIIK